MFRKLLFSLCLAVALDATATTEASAFDWLGHISLDAEGLSSDDPKVRLKAVSDLQGYAIEWTQEFLLLALRDVDMDVRAAAGRALAIHNVEQAIPIITSWLAEPGSQSKLVAADILGTLGAVEAIPPLVRSLGDMDYKVRMSSTIALGKIGDKSVIVPLVTRLEDPKAEVREEAIKQLKGLGDARAVIPLVGIFNDPSLKVRVAAHEAVGSLGDLAAVPALLRSLDTRDDRIKIATVASLGNLHAIAALPRLTSDLSRANRALHGNVAYSMAQIASAHLDAPASDLALVKLIQELTENRGRVGAKEALLVAGVAAVPRLIDHLNGRIRGDSTIAVELLLEIGDSRATPALIAELDRGRISQELILSGLEQLADPRALFPILSLLEDKDPNVRLRAMKTLGSMISEESEAADVIVDRLDDEELEIRKLAAVYLGRLRARSAAPALEELALRAKDIQLRSGAMASLVAIRADSSAKVGLQILKNGPPALRPLAADILSEVANPEAIPSLLKFASDETLSWRGLAISALGSTLRGKEHAKAHSLLRTIALAPHLSNALSAIEALTRMKPHSPSIFRQIAESGKPERQRAAIAALGAIKDSGSEAILILALRSRNDSVAATAAWSLAELGLPTSKQALIQATRHRGSATVVNASAALATLAKDGDQNVFQMLLHHQNALVRVNALIGFSALPSSIAKQSLVKSLTSEHNWIVRIAAVRALSRLGLQKELIKRIAESDHHKEVRSAATTVRKQPFTPSPRQHWSVFRVVDPSTDDTPVRQSARFFIGNDGIATVRYSDIRGRIVFEHFPAGAYLDGALSDLVRY